MKNKEEKISNIRKYFMKYHGLLLNKVECENILKMSLGLSLEVQDDNFKEVTQHKQR